MTLTLPLDKRKERDAVKSAQIALAAASRSVTEKRDSIRVGIIDSFIQLKTLEQTSRIELKNTDIARRRADFAVLRFKSGELSNRDVVEAQNELLSARNAHVRALVEYEQQRLQLLRDIGMLDVQPDGTLAELWPEGGH